MIEMKIVGLPEAQGKIDKVRGLLPTFVKAALFVWADDLISRARQNIDRQALVQSGRLRNSFSRRITVGGPAALTVRVSNDAPHALAFERGRRPGGRLPPVRPLARWVRRAGMAEGADAVSVAWAIARKIQRVGTRPRPFFAPAVDDPRTTAVADRQLRLAWANALKAAK